MVRIQEQQGSRRGSGACPPRRYGRPPRPTRHAARASGDFPEPSESMRCGRGTASRIQSPSRCRATAPPSGVRERKDDMRFSKRVAVGQSRLPRRWSSSRRFRRGPSPFDGRPQGASGDENGCEVTVTLTKSMLAGSPDLGPGIFANTVVTCPGSRGDPSRRLQPELRRGARRRVGSQWATRTHRRSDAGRRPDHHPGVVGTVHAMLQRRQRRLAHLPRAGPRISQGAGDVPRSQPVLRQGRGAGDPEFGQRARRAASRQKPGLESEPAAIATMMTSNSTPRPTHPKTIPAMAMPRPPWLRSLISAERRDVAEDQREDAADPVQPQDAEHHRGNRHAVGRLRRSDIRRVLVGRRVSGRQWLDRLGWVQRRRWRRRGVRHPLAAVPSPAAVRAHRGFRHRPVLNSCHRRLYAQTHDEGRGVRRHRFGSIGRADGVIAGGPNAGQRLSSARRMRRGRLGGRRGSE